MPTGPAGRDPSRARGGWLTAVFDWLCDGEPSSFLRVSATIRALFGASRAAEPEPRRPPMGITPRSACHRRGVVPARWRDEHRELLPVHWAALELRNLLPPTVAVARFAVFTALTTHQPRGGARAPAGGSRRSYRCWWNSRARTSPGADTKSGPGRGCCWTCTARTSTCGRGRTRRGSGQIVPTRAHPRRGRPGAAGRRSGRSWAPLPG